MLEDGKQTHDKAEFKLKMVEESGAKKRHRLGSARVFRFL
jgi:hypothetical protein